MAKAKGLRYDTSPMNSRPPVCPSVCNTFFSELALRFFLIFHMKLGPEFLGKLSFGPNLWIFAQNRVYGFGWKRSKMKRAIASQRPAKTACPDKIWLLRKWAGQLG